MFTAIRYGISVTHLFRNIYREKKGYFMAYCVVTFFIVERMIKCGKETISGLLKINRVVKEVLVPIYTIDKTNKYNNNYLFIHFEHTNIK